MIPLLGGGRGGLLFLRHQGIKVHQVNIEKFSSIQFKYINKMNLGTNIL
jgi:hypothetical protein